jgi:spore coat protein CotH
LTRRECPAIYAQEILPTFELEIDEVELAALQEEWEEADDDDLAEHPLRSFRYEDTVIADASVRLRGNASHWAGQGKMQFEVSFNTYDPKGRFHGLKHVLFDAAEFNRSFLRDRLALAIMRDVGLPAPCANNARVVLNGEYYGLFTNVEKVDSEFLERNFADAGGNLYKRGGPDGWKKKTNEDDPDRSDLDRLEAAATIAELAALMDLDEALLEWATEAVIPDRDGAWAGGLNLYLYNDPKTGFNVIPWDLDDSFTRVEPTIDPVTFKKEAEVFHGRPQYDLAMSDPTWQGRYVDTVAEVLERGYRVDVLQGRIDAWAAQIAEAVAEDPNRPFTLEEHLVQVQEKRDFVAARAAFLEQWLRCRRDGECGGS